MLSDKVLDNLPHEIRRRIEPYVEAVQLMTQTNNAKVLRSMAPSGVRGLILQRGKQGRLDLRRSLRRNPRHGGETLAFDYLERQVKARQRQARIQPFPRDGTVPERTRIEVGEIETELVLAPMLDLYRLITMRLVENGQFTINAVQLAALLELEIFELLMRSTHVPEPAVIVGRSDRR